MHKQILQLSVGFFGSSLVTFISIYALSRTSLSYELSITVFTVFSSLCIFDFGLSRTLLILSTQSICTSSRLVKTFLIFLSLTFPLCFLLFFLLQGSLDSGFYLLCFLAFQVSLCASLNLFRSVAESQRIYWIVSLIRLLQSFAVSLIAFAALGINNQLIFISFIFCINIICLSLLLINKDNLIKKNLSLSISKCGWLPFLEVFDRAYNTPKRSVFLYTLASSFILLVYNMGDRYIVGFLLNPRQVENYLSLQEVLSKPLALSTLFSTSFFGEISYLYQSRYPTLDLFKASKAIFSKYLNAQLFAIIFSFAITLFIIELFFHSISAYIGFGSIIMISIGLILNSIAAHISTFLEASAFHSYRNIGIILMACISLSMLPLLLNSLAFPLSISLFWVLKGLSEILILSCITLLALQRSFSKS